ncbi:MAG: undecaprenyldiphospho-muramoylpentapeptide beta-N-acetylglucosaminyltransferase [Rickettsiaceae bacterium]|nr:undecaprenyldiphospho-muramoylpentapeptide beta-N-acetylglucosaminyltransferase [Rickettsiaceae bacterium]
MIMIKDRSVIVSGGGTGGHLMPALAISDLLYLNGYKVTLITDARCKKYLSGNEIGYEKHIFNIRQPKKILGYALCILDIIRYTFVTAKIILKNNINVVITCGGYTSAPIVLATVLTGAKLILHEQNSYVGKANYYSSYLATRFFLSFMHTVNLPNIAKDKIVWTGIPGRQKSKTFNSETRIENFANKIESQEEKEKFTILVTGGSQGASIFDAIIPELMVLLSKKYKNIEFEIFQQSRSDDYSEMLKIYKNNNIKCEIAKFFFNIEDYYKKSDFYIGRSGASTIYDILEYQIPSIFIPYPYAKNNHQYYNARNLEEFGAAWVIEQKNSSAEKLCAQISQVIEDKNLKYKISSKLATIKPESSKIILQEIQKLFDK